MLQQKSTTGSGNQAPANGFETKYWNPRDYLTCEDFTFRLCDVVGFRDIPEGPEETPGTMVFFGSFTTTVPDPQKRLYGFLKKALKARPIS
jgi:hypothetical protein